MRRCFSLLEVLIAFMLIALSLPLLIAPFLYASVDQREMVEKMKAETASQFAITGFLVDLHLGKIPISGIVDKGEEPLKEEWFEKMGGAVSGHYELTKLKSQVEHKDDEENDKVDIELWEVRFVFDSLSLKKSTVFPFKFTIVRGEAS